MNIKDPSLYLNRELSWLAFNERVLEEAQDKTNPLMERLKFLSITASNLDEFFMVRIASLLQSENPTPDASGLTPDAQLAAISNRVHDMVSKQYSCFTRSLIPAMEKEGIKLLSYAQLGSRQKTHVDAYFNDELYQVLTPMAIDQSRPFPTLNNRTVNLFIEMAAHETMPVRTVEWLEAEGRWRIVEDDGQGPLYAVVQVPTVLPRIIKLPSPESQHHYIFLENIIFTHIDRLFLGHTVTRTGLLRVTRSADLTIEEEDTDDLLGEMARSVRDRRWGYPVRIEISKGISKPAMHLLEKNLDLTPDKIYEINGPLDLTAWMNFAAAKEFAHLRHIPKIPLQSPDFHNQPSMFDVIRKQDVLVHHPYMSFDSVVRFIQEAATDPGVLAIKQTLYRVSGQSPIISALIEAAENGKQVSVLVELKARFDEENNINWAKLLEKSGVHVIYGLVGLKTHCKVCLVVRRDDDAIRRYMHIGTGNYNEATAKIYTDTGLFTCRETFGQDASNLFNVLTGYSKFTDWQKFAVAPVNLRATFLQLIEDEIEQAKAGNPAKITAKMNSLSDAEMIQALYRASDAGVKIRLLVRGICCLRAGVPGVSENISVSSIVDRYLEHNRIFIFGSNAPKVFLASADWMTRNLDRRVEVLFPIEDPVLQEEIINELELSLSDNIKRREQQPDGSYTRPGRRGKPAVHAQLALHRKIAEMYAQATLADKFSF
ncbi:MAG: RNA degradosome polyphosphate kinase [Defluviitaleaceae bacterium]|nr:RNA degradosome polyphosphate kinase [Defluviitaleaceae bacterium]